MFRPSLEEFRELASSASRAGGNTVPVYRQLLADTLTPVSAFRALVSAGGGAAETAFLLESVEGGEKVGRYSFLGAGPFLTFRSDLEKIEVLRGGAKDERRPEGGRTVIDELEDVLDRYRPVALEGLPRFCGGAVGYFSYDTVRLLEPVGDGAANELGLPDLYFGLYDTLVIFDHVSKVVKVVCHADCTNVGPEEAYARAQGRVNAVVEKLGSASVEIAEDVHLARDSSRGFESNVTKPEFTRAVDAALEYIRAGDVIQVVLSQRLQTRTHAAPFDLYRALRTVNPSPYMFYLQFPDLQLVGSSPEMMLRVVKQEGAALATTRPIAGTRPRGGSPEEDAALAEELRSDPKECAEHSMLLDLGRNDVGRVAEYGSVEIVEEMIVERYSHVMHLVSEVQGRLKDGLTALDALKSCLPAGTLSGAPKVRAMQIIDELEKTRRGPYGGAVGYLDFFGNMDTCITIRTIVLPGPVDAAERDAYVQAGAGIVADSVPEREYEECLTKAKALLRTIELAEAAFGKAGG